MLDCSCNVFSDQHWAASILALGSLRFEAGRLYLKPGRSRMMKDSGNTMHSLLVVWNCMILESVNDPKGINHAAAHWVVQLRC